MNLTARSAALLLLAIHIAPASGGETTNPVTVVTKEQMQELYGLPWKCNDEAQKWMGEAIEHIQAIQPGSTRTELLQWFQPSADVGSRFRHRFEYRESRDNALFYVDVEFKRDPTRIPNDLDLDLQLDLITRISAPFVTTVQQAPQQQVDETWVDEALRRIRTIKPGMTREQMYQVFRGQGGLSSPVQETLVSRDCPYFQVTFEFEAVGRPPRDADGRITFPGSAQDVIIHSSAPYLDFEHAG